MARLFRWRGIRMGALLVLVALATGIAADFHHTDDGCRVEIHCIACQNAMVLSTGLRGPLPTLAPSLAVIGGVTCDPPRPFIPIDGPAMPSRAPPLA